MAIVRVQAENFDAAACSAQLTAGRTDIGGIGCFIGTVRGTSKGRPIRSMTLEHYPAMTERAMAAIASEAERRWDLLGCILIHRVGTLLPGDNIVLVMAASAHRQSALDATGFLIDWLKTRAPFWKKETLADGTGLWVDGNAGDEAAASRWGNPAQAEASPLNDAE